MKLWLQPPVLALAALLVVSCSKSGKPGAGQAASAPSRAVKTAVAAPCKMDRAVSVTGSLAALDRSTLTIKVPGRLRLLSVDLGSRVAAGETLAQVEPRDYELRVAQAEAALAQARAALGLPIEGTNDVARIDDLSPVLEARAVFDEAARNRGRVGELATAKIASASESDTAEAAFLVASNRLVKSIDDARLRQAALSQRRVELDLAKQQLTDTTLRAPFGGVVETRQASVGEYITTGTPVITLVRTDPLRLRLEVPERDAPAVRLGQTVRFHVEGDTNVFTTRLTRLSPAIRELNRMLPAEADVPGGALRPGSFVRAEIVTVPEDSGLVVPEAALVVFAGLEKVVAAREGQARELSVVTGRRGPGWVEIVSGLMAGERVVLNPGNLRTGERVEETASSPGAVASVTNRTVEVPSAR